MIASITPLTLQILVINNDAGEMASIRTQLHRDMRVLWHMTESPNIAMAAADVADADIIILKPEVNGLTRMEVFQDVQNLVFETPIIVLTNPIAPGRAQGADTGFSTYLMEQGAADTVVRGQFARLVDAIEFAMIRQKITTATREDADATLADSQDEDDDRLRAGVMAQARENERHRQIVRMFLGDYSAERQT